MLLKLYDSDKIHMLNRLSLSIDTVPTKSSNNPKGGGFGLAISHPKHSTFTRQNETAAGVALVKAAAVGFTMHADHRLLEDEGGGPPA